MRRPGCITRRPGGTTRRSVSLRVPDPTGFAAGDANLYRYVGNNPATKTDPWGLSGGQGGEDNGTWDAGDATDVTLSDESVSLAGAEDDVAVTMSSSTQQPRWWHDKNGGYARHR